MGEKKIEFEQDDLVSTGWIARKTGYCTETIRREIEAGRMRAERKGRNFRVVFQDYLEWRMRYFEKVTQ